MECLVKVVNLCDSLVLMDEDTLDFEVIEHVNVFIITYFP